MFSGFRAELKILRKSKRGSKVEIIRPANLNIMEVIESRGYLVKVLRKGGNQIETSVTVQEKECKAFSKST
jgi:hypothetical protein